MRNPRVALPQPRYEGTMSVEEALLRRRSVRDFVSATVTLDDLGQLLWAAQGLTERAGSRTAPSAGALYPLELYVTAGMVQACPPGLYRYQPQEQALELVAGGDVRPALSRVAFEQAFVAEAAAVLVICAVYERMTAKYGQRGVRYVHLEAGHAAQNVYLQAVSLRLGTVAVGAFSDESVKQVLGLPAHEEPLYLMPVGRL